MVLVNVPILNFSLFTYVVFMLVVSSTYSSAQGNLIPAHVLQVKSANITLFCMNFYMNIIILTVYVTGFLKTN